VVIRRGKEVDDDDPPSAPARRGDLDAELDELLRQGG
jgi:hypothetical protein